MAQIDLLAHLPAVVLGALVGIFAFVPLLLALVPVLRRTCDANMAKGMLGVIVSFAILFVAVVAVYLVARGALLPFLVGELGGFFVCWVAVAMAVIAHKG